MRGNISLGLLFVVGFLVVAGVVVFFVVKPSGGGVGVDSSLGGGSGVNSSEFFNDTYVNVSQENQSLVDTVSVVVVTNATVNVTNVTNSTAIARSGGGGGGGSSSSVSYAPVVSVVSVNTTNSTAIVSVTVDDFVGVGSFDLVLTYNDSVANIVNVSLASGVGGSLVVDLNTSGVITLGWSSGSGVSLSDGSGILDFSIERVWYGVSFVEFNTSGCVWYDVDDDELVDSPADDFYVDGSLEFYNSARDAPVVSLSSVLTNATNATLSVIVDNFVNISAFNLTIMYDASIADPTNVVLDGGLAGGLSYDLSTSGVIVLNWSDSSAVTLADGSTLVDIEFDFVDYGLTDVSFDNNGDTCAFYGSDNVSLDDDPSSSFYVDGSLEFQAYAPVITVGSDSTLLSNVSLPVTVDDFTNVIAFNLTILYDSSYGYVPNVSLGVGVGGNLSAVVSGSGVLVVSWVSGSGVSLVNGSNLFNLSVRRGSDSFGDFVFGFNNSGDASVFYNANGRPMIDEPTVDYYFNGTVTFLQPAGPIYYIDDLFSNESGTGYLPEIIGSVNITVDNFEDVGAVKLTVDYGNSDGEYAMSVVNVTLGQGVSFSGTADKSQPGRVILQYSANSGQTLANDSTLFTINFLRGGFGLINITFNDSVSTRCYTTRGDNTTFNDTPNSAYYYDGSVNFQGDTSPIYNVSTVSTSQSNATVSITVEDYTEIGGSDLMIHYDPSIMTALSVQFNPSVNFYMYLSDLTAPGTVSTTILHLIPYQPGVSLPNGTVLFNITFEKVMNGQSDIWWNNSDHNSLTASPSYYELVDLPTDYYYINGSVTFT